MGNHGFSSDCLSTTATPEIPRHPAKVYWIRRTIVGAVLVLVVVIGYYAVTLAFALANPSYGTSMSSRAAEWGRSHGLGVIVTWAEAEAYRLNPPRWVARRRSRRWFGADRAEGSHGRSLGATKDMKSPAKHPLPGEGVWHVAGRETANGIPTMYEAFVRPDAVHTSYVVGVAWMDPTLLTAQLYSGSYIPVEVPTSTRRPSRPREQDPRRRVQRGLSNPGLQWWLLHRRQERGAAREQRRVRCHL